MCLRYIELLNLIAKQLDLQKKKANDEKGSHLESESVIYDVVRLLLEMTTKNDLDINGLDNSSTV